VGVGGGRRGVVVGVGVVVGGRGEVAVGRGRGVGSVGRGLVVDGCIGSLVWKMVFEGDYPAIVSYEE
jgi:hypothetical protein